ncbi:MAG: glycosyltransferase family 2 protein [Nitrososphaerales archaeon]
MYPKISIIIVNMNGKNMLEECLTSLLSLTEYSSYNIIVVDNGSTDGSVEMVKDKFPNVEIIPLNRNYGFTKANNIGIRYAFQKFDPDYILLLNNDTKIIQKNWLKKMVDSRYDLVQPIILNKDGTVQSKGGGILILGIPYLIKGDEKPLWISFASALISREVFDKIGLLNEDYVIYSEDLEFCLRAKAHNFSVGVANTEIIHYGNSTIIRLSRKRQIFHYYKTRNDYWTITRYYRSKLMKAGYIAFSIFQSLTLLLRKNIEGSKSVIMGLFQALLNPCQNFYSFPTPNTSLFKLLIIFKSWLENSIRY